MSEIARFFFEVLKLGRSPEALMARAAFAEHRGMVLEAKSKRFSGRRRDRILGRAYWWRDRAIVLKERAKTREAPGNWHT